jgi:predicted dehydrogenase
MVQPRLSSWRVDATQGGRSRAFADIGSHWCDLVEWVSGEQLTAQLSVAVPQHAQRRARRCSRDGKAGSFGMNVVISGQLGSWLRAGHRVSAFRETVSDDPAPEPARETFGPTSAVVLGPSLKTQRSLG